MKSLIVLIIIISSFNSFADVIRCDAQANEKNVVVIQAFDPDTMEMTESDHLAVIVNHKRVETHAKQLTTLYVSAVDKTRRNPVTVMNLTNNNNETKLVVEFVGVGVPQSRMLISSEFLGALSDKLVRLSNLNCKRMTKNK